MMPQSRNMNQFIIFTNPNSHLQYPVIHLQQMESRGLRKILSEISSTCNEWSPGDLEKFRPKNFIHLQRMDAQGLRKFLPQKLSTCNERIPGDLAKFPKIFSDKFSSKSVSESSDHFSKNFPQPKFLRHL